MRKKENITLDFQTPAFVGRYMVSLLPPGVRTVLEPTPGSGGIVQLLAAQGYQVIAPPDFFQLDKTARFDAVVMNPPFNAKYAYGVPDHLQQSGLRLGYQILLECMRMSDTVVALMPWFTISDSDRRLSTLKRFGMRSLTALPRRTFAYARIQTCVFHMEKGFKGKTEFAALDLLSANDHPELFTEIDQQLQEEQKINRRDSGQVWQPAV